MTDTTAPKAAHKMADLKLRTLSAIVMIAVAGAALWAGGWVFTTFVALIAAGLLWEWWGLISKFNTRWWSRALWMLGGVVYIGGAVWSVLHVRFGAPMFFSFWLIGMVVAIDTGAYLFGRFIGGPKVARAISPSKTWAGLAGALFASGIAIQAGYWLGVYSHGGYVFSPFDAVGLMLLAGGPLVILAQAGDFFESWMKRRAGVKDSGDLIPGHGGLFDRLDGFLAVAVVFPYWAYALTW